MDFAKNSGAGRDRVSVDRPDDAHTVSSASTDLPGGPQPVPLPAAGAPSLPRWVRSAFFVIDVVLLIELGLILLLLPWKFPDLWLNTPFVSTHPLLRAFLANYFVRGAISGLGLVDIWLGLWDAVHYRARK